MTGGFYFDESVFSETFSPGTESNRLSTHSNFSCSSGTDPDFEVSSNHRRRMCFSRRRGLPKFTQ